MGIFFAALGLPGLCGFIGEFWVVMGTWSYSAAMAVIAASVVILTAGYILWTIQRVYLGAEYKGPHAEALTPITRRETLIAAPLLVFAIIFGVYSQALFDYTEPSVNKVVDDLTAWQKNQPVKTTDGPPAKTQLPSPSGRGTQRVPGGEGRDRSDVKSSPALTLTLSQRERGP
jgi:NADH-quinone oxidoreductase subunit M